MIHRVHSVSFIFFALCSCFFSQWIFLDSPSCHPLLHFVAKKGNSHSVDVLVVQPGQALPLFIVMLKPLPQNTKPREIAVEYLNTPSTLEVESDTIDSAEYLNAALQHHFKTAVPLEVENFDETRQDYSPLTDVGVLNQVDLTKHKLRVKEVPSFFVSFFFHS